MIGVLYIAVLTLMVVFKPKAPIDPIDDDVEGGQGEMEVMATANSVEPLIVCYLAY